MWKNMAQIFQNYMGTGLAMIWFLAAVIYLFLSEKRKDRRILFVYFPILILLLFFNPLFAGLFFATLGAEVYFRVCWLLPVTTVTAYAAISIRERLSGVRKGIFTVAAVLMIVLSGRPVYDNPLYSVAENCYHVPDSVVHLCDAIVTPGREVMAVFPRELLLYVRQYSPLVCMPYGRDHYDIAGSDLREVMEKEPLNLEEATPLANGSGCHYIILKEGRETLQDPQDYGWELYGQMDGYLIYRNTEVELIVP
ncbi:MAG: hypothetical protein NC432_04815 [Roseburia sp.]|nr:hypothetical protein [Roseburia sp.]MCM1098629.1 hypothetical protein [Ruminococcus flavefaciens]